MKKALNFFILSLLAVFSLAACPVSAQEEPETLDGIFEEISVPGELGLEPGEGRSDYYTARVIEILGSAKNDDPADPSFDQYRQDVAVVFLEGPEEGQTRTVSYDIKSSDPDERLEVGEKVYVIRVYDGISTSYYIPDRYRLGALLWLAVAFFFLVIAAARFKGLGALVGLAFSFFVIIKFILPRILAGDNPLWVCLGGAIAIAFVSIYVAHGFKARTTLAVVSTMIIIVLTAVLDYVVIHWTKLFGIGSEEAIYAQFGIGGIINLRGLLLGGIIIGVLGVLDDITTAQAAVVDELRRANPALKFKELYQRGLSVGREHIVSLINTLVLAYVGASFPLVLLFQQSGQPLAFVLNSHLMAEEIVRALIGSAALILAVPLTTALSAYAFSRYKSWGVREDGHPPVINSY